MACVNGVETKTGKPCGYSQLKTAEERAKLVTDSYYKTHSGSRLDKQRFLENTLNEEMNNMSFKNSAIKKIMR